MDIHIKRMPKRKMKAKIPIAEVDIMNPMARLNTAGEKLAQ